MEFQITNNFKINYSKNIGKVLYIVEGEKTEINVLLKVFKYILGYNVVYKKRNNTSFKLQSVKNPNSVIYILNSRTSNISSIQDYKYLADELLNIIKCNSELNIDIQNIRKYYIFDCDRPEDKEEQIKDLINKYKNSLDLSEEYEFGGMLLLNYPSIESFLIENFATNTFTLSDSLIEEGKIKEYLNKNKYLPNSITKDTLENAIKEMIFALENISCSCIDLDDTSKFNINIYDYEKQRNFKYILSLIIISFIDMGIIEIIE